MQVSKSISLYMPVLVDDQEVQRQLKPGFWRKTQSRLSGLTVSDRFVRYNAVQYYGNAATSKKPATDYFRVGRVRYRADWPGTIDVSSGNEAPLNLPKLQLLENAVLLPTAGNQVAVMGPIRGLVSIAATARWLTSIWGLEKKNKSIALLPVIDAKVKEKLENAVGVSRLFVRIPYDSEFDAGASNDGGVVRKAVEEGTSGPADGFDFEATWSLGNRKKSTDLTERLLNGARWLTRTGGPSRIDANLILPHGKGFRTEQRNLIEDFLATTVKFNVDESQELDEEAILTAMFEALKDIRKK